MMTVKAFSTEEERREGRNRFAKDLIDMGLSENDAYVIFDLAVHAKEEVFKAVTKVCDTAPEHLRTVIMGVSLDLVHGSLGAMQNVIEDTIVKGFIMTLASSAQAETKN